MSRKILSLLFMLSLVVAGCTPTIINTNNSTSGESNAQGSNTTTPSETPKPADGKEVSTISYNEYKNPAVNYSVNIPTNWYWRHYHKGELGADSAVDDYLFISPTHSIETLGTESPAEIIIEVSKRPLSDFSQAGEQETVVSVAGQNGVKVSTIVNNEVFDNFQKIEYRFIKDGKTYRILYLADAGLSNNEAVFEQIVNSFKFSK